MNNKRKYDWFKFCVWFVCGTIVGAFFGVRIWGRSDFAMEHSMRPGLWLISISALVLGLLAGCASNSGCDEW